MVRVLLALALLFPAAAYGQDSDGDGVPNASDALPCDGTGSGVAFAPAEASYGSMLFEDQWPNDTDYDFNDVAVAYNYRLVLDSAGRATALRATFHVIAAGGRLDNGLGLQLPVAASAVQSLTRTIGTGTPEPLTALGDSQLTVVLSENVRELFEDQAGQINSLDGEPRLEGQVVVLDVRFSTPVALSAGGAPYDLFAFRSQTPALEIHLPQYSGTARFSAAQFGTGIDASRAGWRFVDGGGRPFAIAIPAVIPYPSEATDIAALFPDILGFGASGGVNNRNFYVSQVQLAAAFDGGSPTLASPAITVDTACLPRTFLMTGADQSYTPTTTRIEVHVFGAAGGGTYAANKMGGAGGYARATIAVAPGTPLRVVVGQGGAACDWPRGCNGGGMSGIFRTDGTPLVIAGGGGGSGNGSTPLISGGAAGGNVGQAGGTYLGGHGGGGGTQSAGGARGTPYTSGTSGSYLLGGEGGNPTLTRSYGGGGRGGMGNLGGGGGGGGGGYYGGGGASTIPSYAHTSSGGGGGSSYIGGSGVSSAVTAGGSYGTPPAAATSDVWYRAGISAGTTTAGGNGLVVILALP